MILVDTSVWIAHLRQGEPGLTRILEDGLVITHPFVLGELACGQLRNRREVLAHLDHLSSAPEATSQEARSLIETHNLIGQGLGWTDVHLLASCRLARASLWSLDQPLIRAARRLGVAA